ncbi:MAG: alpha/beta hydrolase, partial [Methylocella sp.]
MRGRLMKLTKRTALLLAVVIVTLFAGRVYLSQSGAPLKPWHTFVPHEMKADVIDGASWADYLRAEDKIFAEVLHEVSQKLDADERIPINRYFEGSPVYP